MLLPDGSNCQLNLPTTSENINALAANRDHTIIVVATDTSLYFYLADSRLLATIYQRDDEDIKERGTTKKVYWKPDSTSICITTDKNYVNIYAVEITQTPPSFNLHDPIGEAKVFARESSEFYINQNRSQINVTLSVVARLEAEPSCVLSFKEELILSLTDGWLHRLTWSGNVLPELSFNIRTFCHEPQHPSPTALYISDIAPFLGGICAVLNDGRAALFVSNTADFKPESITLLWAVGLRDACCCSTNFKYRVIYFGCRNGDIAGYSLDDVNGGLILLFRIHLRLKDGIEYLDRISSVRQISCLAVQGTAFAVIWNNKITDDKGRKLSPGSPTDINGDTKAANQMKSCPPTLAIFSPFGEQWWCSLEMEHSNSTASTDPANNYIYLNLDWASDGYQLWLATSWAGIQTINMIKSIPNQHDQLMMVGADRIYLCPDDHNDQIMANSAPHLIWQQFKPPHNYITSNWPIKYVSISQNAPIDQDRVLAVGGLHGFCFYNFKTKKWRMFRKEAQEKSLFLTGGLAIYNEFILCSACNLEARDDEADRLYVFRTDEQLDLDLVPYTMTNRILQMKLSGSHMLTFDVRGENKGNKDNIHQSSNSVISIYKFVTQYNQRKNSTGKPVPHLEMDCVAEIRISEFMTHPNCLVSLELGKLNFHSDGLPFCDDLDSLLINVSGHLLLLSPMQSQVNGHEKNNGTNGEETVAEFQLHPPTLVATCVEEFWLIHPTKDANNASQSNGKIPYISEALWINAGCKKNRIWLPLSLEVQRSANEKKSSRSPLVQQNSRTFISRRIMLPFAMDLYPLYIDSNYLACGVNCTSLEIRSSGGKLMPDNVSLTTNFTEDDSLNDYLGLAKMEENGPPQLRVHSLFRSSEVFIHKLLKQLLKRNLGSYAFELASACRSLSYFRHILELLLHDILDEEATCSEPIPDPLLPTVVTFLREFPSEYLQTVVHCARKTELAFWNLLFSVSNHPRQLFQMCLQEGQLETATSCLIILHSLISIQESSKLAFQLLEEALNKHRWNIAQDIIRFMQNINRATERDSQDYGDSPESPIQGKFSSLPHHHHPFNSSNDEFHFPLFSSQIDIDPTGMPSFIQQRRRSGSGKMSTTDAKQITSFATTRIQSKTGGTSATTISPPKEKSGVGKIPGKSASPPPLALKMPPQKMDQNHHQQQQQHYSGLDDILTKHAANLLEDYALRDLGAFSSYLPFDFVAFFRRPENAFAIEASEFPLVLMKLHAQFNWPYPIGVVGHLATGSSAIGQGNERLIPSNGNDALMSPTTSTTMTDDSSSITRETTNGSSVISHSASSATMNNEPNNEEDSNSLGSTSINTGVSVISDWKLLEKIAETPRGKKDEKVSTQADDELSYIFCQLQRAEAFEWLFLLTILRRDIRLFNEQVLGQMRELPDQAKRFERFLDKIRAGTRELYLWAQTRCPAYLHVMRVFKDFVG